MEKIEVSKSSEVNVPVISDRFFWAKRKSSATNSIVSVEIYWHIAAVIKREALSSCSTCRSRAKNGVSEVGDKLS